MQPLFLNAGSIYSNNIPISADLSSAGGTNKAAGEPGSDAVSTYIKGGGEINGSPKNSFSGEKLSDKTVTGVQISGKSGRNETKFNLNAFFEILDKKLPADDCRIVSYDVGELNTPDRRKRKHVEGVQLGQDGRNGTWPSGRKRNAKTWADLRTAIGNAGCDNVDEIMTKLFDKAHRKNDPMTVKHLKKLREYFLDNYILNDIKENLSDIDLLRIQHNQKQLLNIFLNIKKLDDNISKYFTNIPTFKTFKDMFMSGGDKMTHVSLKEGLKKCISNTKN